MSKPSKPAPKKTPEGAAKAVAKKAAPRAKAEDRKGSRINSGTDVEQPESESPVSAPTAKAVGKATTSASDAALLKRLPEMTDFQLRAYQGSTARISRDTAHAKSGAAKATLALIEQEMARRTAAHEKPSPPRASVASPKQGKKRSDD